MCSADNGQPDAAPDSGGPEACFGTGLIQDLCVSVRPDTLSIDGPRMFNTAVDCTSIEPQPGGPSLCVQAHERIVVGPTGVVFAFGPNALVLVASDQIEIAGIIDASGHRGTTAVAPGARTQCGALAGSQGNTNSGAGGGAGGGYVGAGGNGGRGGIGVNGGVGATSPQTVAVGGCAGGRGGNGGAGTGGGTGGPGGGAFYAISTGTITITGFIAAFGGGGGGSENDNTSGGGGGGGGAGGLIGLDAPTVTVTGVLVANGGGGGGGNGDDQVDLGSAGAESEDPMIAAPGGAGGQGGGGAGGAGFVQGTPARAGTAVTICALCGGGGGGGGAGSIRVFGGTKVFTGVISPAPM